MKLIASGLALELILALTQRRSGARLAELAGASGAPLSSAQRAMRLLIADGLVRAQGGRRPLYRLDRAHAALSGLLSLAFASLPTDRVLTILARSNPAIEFTAADGEGHIVVRSPTADPRDALAFEVACARLAAVGGPVDVLQLEHQDGVGSERRDPRLHARARRARILTGTLALSFPVHRRGPVRGRPRGRRRSMATLFPRLSRRALAEIARAHGLGRLRLFGSAARGDLGPASDVDVLVEPSTTGAVSLTDLVRLESDLERVFGRHVDLVTPGGLGDEVREAIEREGVTIHG